MAEGLEQWPIGVLLFVLVGTMALGGATVPAAGKTVQGMLAAQIRSQGFVCHKPLGAARDGKRSRPDHARVWVLKCSNAVYQVSRAPVIAAKVEPLR